MENEKTVIIPIEDNFVINVKKDVYERLKNEQYVCIIDFSQKMVTMFSMVEKGEKDNV